MKAYNVAVVGATGAVGREMLKVLEQRRFPVSKLRVMASPKSKGKVLEFCGEKLIVEDLNEASFRGIEIALFSAGASRSLSFAPKAASEGAVVIDNSSAFRMDPKVPLVVPEVNPDDAFLHNGIIANPNCSTIQMVVALNPIHKEAKIKRIVVSTYQAVSGTGAKAIFELEEQIRSWVAGEPMKCTVYPYQIAFNVLPHIDSFTEDGYTKEELKMLNETRKILHDPSIRVSATTVRVPVWNCHSESVNIETERDISPERARQLLETAPGVKVLDDPGKNLYPLAIFASGKDDVFVGRIRRDNSVEHGLNMWIVADNLRKGAALNAVQIAEVLIGRAKKEGNSSA
ncbi:MAG TPA: aspartate-semialdehyde dehydrogenase [Firmicutes bacterium]|nr:aspartate-semialdehyde dehydrogenase [Bacillota bacterium]